jgi:hypothetical protein
MTRTGAAVSHLRDDQSHVDVAAAGEGLDLRPDPGHASSGM